MYRLATQPSKALGEQYGSATWATVQYYTDSACTDEITGSSEKALINTPAGKHLEVTVTGSSRTRVAKNQPTALGADFYEDDASSGDHHGFGDDLGNSVTFSVTIAAGVASGLTGPVYYALNGTGTSLQGESDLSSLIGTVIEESSWLDGTDTTALNQNLTVTVSLEDNA